MQQSTKINEYLKTVCEQIRWKKAHDIISKEIEDHIIDQKSAFMSNGLDEEMATDRAIAEMGDPIFVGMELDRTHRPKTEWSIIILTGIILLIGLIIRAFVMYDSNRPEMLTKSIISTILGIGGMVGAYFIDFTIIGRYPKTIFFGLISATIGIMMITPLVNGQYFYAQFMLLFFPTTFAGIIYSMRSKGYLGIIVSGLFWGITLFIGMAIPSLSSVILYSLSYLILLTFSICKGNFNVKKLNGLLLAYIPTIMTAVMSAFIMISNSPYRLNRLLITINPSLDPMGAGYMVNITRKIIANAKLFGAGTLEVNGSIMLPTAYIGIDDYLLTYLIHRFGWISFIIIMIVISLFITRAIMLFLRQKNVLGRLIAASVLIAFTVQVILYVANNLGFPLFSPLTLPLISYGRTATIINMILIGIMLSVFKSGDLAREQTIISTGARNTLFEIMDGKIIIHLNTK
ncbi:FtsW/RodA/SpoVE family cell cycle protein [Cellulosilyticum sp. I15G10I2]|uniref:FtsW/RodA/SpoVE family cell cycle protein n=1 Tax=Cellulosilyticum sp. I15G10I2 TaxID=1892843 RepID=UPI00085BC9FC|nr:FtsW/RodA/SpoVE family cell cycle protein [Cellulosilyticum sp. I15G10I2]